MPLALRQIRVGPLYDLLPVNHLLDDSFEEVAVFPILHVRNAWDGIATKHDIPIDDRYARVEDFPVIFARLRDIQVVAHRVLLVAKVVMNDRALARLTVPE